MFESHTTHQYNKKDLHKCRSFLFGTVFYLAQCSSILNAGADTPDTRSIKLGKSSGQFDFAYNTYSLKDEGNTLFDACCVGASGTKTFTYSGSATQITMQVIPNCLGGSVLCEIILLHAQNRWCKSQ